MLQGRLSSVEGELEFAKRDCAQALAEKERSVHGATPPYPPSCSPAPSRLMRDATDVSGAHTTAVASLKRQLAASEHALAEEQASTSKIQVGGAALHHTPTSIWCASCSGCHMQLAERVRVCLMCRKR